MPDPKSSKPCVGRRLILVVLITGCGFGLIALVFILSPNQKTHWAITASVFFLFSTLAFPKVLPPFKSVLGQMLASIPAALGLAYLISLTLIDTAPLRAIVLFIAVAPVCLLGTLSAVIIAAHPLTDTNRNNFFHWFSPRLFQSIVLAQGVFIPVYLYLHGMSITSMISLSFYYMPHFFFFSAISSIILSPLYLLKDTGSSEPT